MIDALIAITNIVGHHPLNQALLASLADPLTDALASLLQSLPPPSVTPTAVATATDPGSTPTQRADESLTGGGLLTTHSHVSRNESQEEGDVAVGVHDQARRTPAGKSEQAGGTAAVSALTAQLKAAKLPSALTAQLQATETHESQATETHESQATETHESQAWPVPGDPKPAVDTADGIDAAAAATAAAADQGPLIPDLRASEVDSASAIARAHGTDTPEPSLLPDSSHGHEPSEGLDSLQGEALQAQKENRLARQFVYHVLMLLPAETVRQRAAFWMAHVAGVPEIQHICVKVAVVQDPQVSYLLPLHLMYCSSHALAIMFLMA